MTGFKRNDTGFLDRILAVARRHASLPKVISSVQLTRGATVMPKLYILFAMIAVISLLAACNRQNNGSHINDLMDASKITEIRVALLDIHSRGDKVFKTITTPTEIGNLVSFANEQVLAGSELKSDIDQMFSIQDRTALVDLAFYRSGKYLGTLGLGHYDNGKYFLKYSQYYSESECCENKTYVISSEQKKKLLDLIGYSEHEFKQLILAN